MPHSCDDTVLFPATARPKQHVFINISAPALRQHDSDTPSRDEAWPPKRDFTRAASAVTSRNGRIRHGSTRKAAVMASSCKRVVVMPSRRWMPGCCIRRQQVTTAHINPVDPQYCLQPPRPSSCLQPCPHIASQPCHVAPPLVRHAAAPPARSRAGTSRSLRVRICRASASQPAAAGACHGKCPARPATDAAVRSLAQLASCQVLALWQRGRGVVTLCSHNLAHPFTRSLLAACSSFCRPQQLHAATGFFQGGPPQGSQLSCKWQFLHKPTRSLGRSRPGQSHTLGLALSSEQRVRAADCKMTGKMQIQIQI